MKNPLHSTKRKLSNGATGFTNEQGEWVCTGSAMGRRDHIPSDFITVKKLHLVKLKMSSCGCYDSGGAYWGQGLPMYWAYGESDTEQAEMFMRAKNRENAKAQALARFPSAKFYN